MIRLFCLSLLLLATGSRDAFCSIEKDQTAEIRRRNRTISDTGYLYSRRECCHQETTKPIMAVPQKAVGIQQPSQLLWALQFDLMARAQHPPQPTTLRCVALCSGMMPVVAAPIRHRDLDLASLERQRVEWY
mmetsp:Transcript_19589/g.54639  ORF Transcript_19589/g.54639 Transcript_19589/m.54639 type:complete len:132 (-) Transcript_19589:1456-1851(-)